MVTYVWQVDSPNVGQNLTDGMSWAKSKNPQRVVKIGFCGGSAVYDGRIEVSYGSEKVIETYNNSTTEIDCQNDEFAFWVSSNKRCSPGDQINIEVKAAAATTYRLMVDLKEGYK